MTRYIKADELIHKLKTAIELGIKSDESVAELEAVLSDVESMATVDAIPVRHGEWSEVYDDKADLFFRRKFVCSACGGWNTYGFATYCPECGAEMINSTKRTMKYDTAD